MKQLLRSTRSGPTYPLSRTNSANQTRSLRRSSLRPSIEAGSVSAKPSRESAFVSSITSRLVKRRVDQLVAVSDDRVIALSNSRSRAIVSALAMSELPSSSTQCFPGSHGTFNMKAKMISTERCLLMMTWFASVLQWAATLVDRAAVVCMNLADAAITEVNKNAERLRTN